MESIKELLNFCNELLFYDFDNVEIADKMNLTRECIIDIFHQTTPTKTILESLFLTDYITMGIYNYNDDGREELDRHIYELREKILQTSLNK